MIRPFLASLGLALTISLPLAAQRPDSTKKDTAVVELPPIEVVGSIRPSAGPNVISNVPARVTILSGDQVDAYEPRILSDVLAQEAGFSLYDDLGSGYKIGMSSRGFLASPVVGTPQGISVFLDGVRQNEPDAAEVNFDLLPMQYVQRIELLSGTAALQGRNSLGGVMNLATVHGDGPPGGEVELQGGSWKTFTGNGSVSGSTKGGLSYFVGAGYNREDGWRQVTGARQYNGFFNLGKFTNTWGINLQGFGANSRAETAGSLPASVFDIKPDSNLSSGDFEDLTLYQGVLSGYHQLGAGRASFRAYYRDSKGDRFNGNQPGDPDSRFDSKNSTFGWGADYRWSHLLGRAVLGLRLGTDGSTNRTTVQLFDDSTKLGGGLALTTSAKSPLWDVSGFATADLTVSRVTLSGGGRYDYIRIPYEDLLDPTNNGTNSYSKFDPKGGIAVDAGGGLSLYGSVGRAFRAPAVIEVACADPAVPCSLPFSLGADPPIKPVTATTYEAGGTWSRDRVVFTTSVYRSDVRNDIFLFGTANPATGSTLNGYFGNIDRTRRTGAEVSLSVGFGRGHSVYVNYAWTRATFQSTDTLATPIDTTGLELIRPGNVIPLVPTHTVKFGAAFQLTEHLSVRGDGRYIGRQWLRGDEANVSSQLPGFFVGDARLGWSFGRWDLIGTVTNLFNRHYAVFGTFNVNEGDPAAPIEQFLTPGGIRAFRFIARLSFGHGSAASSAAGDRD